MSDDNSNAIKMSPRALMLIITLFAGGAAGGGGATFYSSPKDAIETNTQQLTKINETLVEIKTKLPGMANDLLDHEDRIRELEKNLNAHRTQGAHSEADRRLDRLEQHKHGR